ncbi:MAG TPA: adenylate/guanylate cyclase domain-containing protein [Gaiellaceae bacterium]
MGVEQPSGTVTLVFTDIEGSTRLLQQLGRDDYYAELSAHREQIRAAFARHDGYEVDYEGDSFFYAFRSAASALAAVDEAMESLATGPIRIRVGIHTGEPGLDPPKYVGLDVHRAARIMASAHGGQVLLSQTTRELLEQDGLVDLGRQRLKDLPAPVRLFQFGKGEFPPLRTVSRSRRRRHIGLASLALALAAVVAGVVVAVTNSGSGDVTVVPNSVAVVNPTSNRLIADVHVGSQPVAVAVGDGGVWVANSSDGTVTRIDPRTRRVVRTIGNLGGDVSDITTGFGSVWIAGGSDGTLTRLDPRDNAVERTLTFKSSTLFHPSPVFNVTTGADSVWFTYGESVLRLDPTTNAVTKRVAVDGPLAITFGDGALWVTTVGDRVLRIDPATGSTTAAFSLPTQVIAPVTGGGSIWVLERARLPYPYSLQADRIWSLDTDTGDVLNTAATGRAPSGLAWGDGTLWCMSGHGVQRFDRLARQVATIRVGQGMSAIAVTADAVWIAVQGTSD